MKRTVEEVLAAAGSREEIVLGSIDSSFDVKDGIAAALFALPEVHPWWGKTPAELARVYTLPDGFRYLASGTFPGTPQEGAWVVVVGPLADDAVSAAAVDGFRERAIQIFDEHTTIELVRLLTARGMPRDKAEASVARSMSQRIDSELPDTREVIRDLLQRAKDATPERIDIVASSRELDLAAPYRGRVGRNAAGEARGVLGIPPGHPWHGKSAEEIGEAVGQQRIWRCDAAGLSEEGADWLLFVNGVSLEHAAAIVVALHWMAKFQGGEPDAKDKAILDAHLKATEEASPEARFEALVDRLSAAYVAEEDDGVDSDDGDSYDEDDDSDDEADDGDSYDEDDDSDDEADDGDSYDVPLDEECKTCGHENQEHGYPDRGAECGFVTEDDEGEEQECDCAFFDCDGDYPKLQAALVKAGLKKETEPAWQEHRGYLWRRVGQTAQLKLPLSHPWAKLPIETIQKRELKQQPAIFDENCPNEFGAIAGGTFILQREFAENVQHEHIERMARWWAEYAESAVNPTVRAYGAGNADPRPAPVSRTAAPARDLWAVNNPKLDKSEQLYRNKRCARCDHEWGRHSRGPFGPCGPCGACSSDKKCNGFVPRPEDEQKPIPTATEDVSAPTREKREGTHSMAKVKLIEGREQVNIGGKKPPSFETEGTKIILPEGMSLREGAEWLLKREREMEEVVAIDEDVRGFPLDAAIAVHKALAERYGWTDIGATPSFWGPIPPKTIAVATGVNEFTTVAVGRIQPPNLDGGFLQFGTKRETNGSLTLRMMGEVKKKFRDDMAAVAQRAREILKAQSIYKGKAIKVTFPKGDDPFSVQDMPEFYDVNKVNPEEIVFSKAVYDQIRVSLYTPIQQTQACRDAKIPLKRTILFAGQYGVGKTLTAAAAAKISQENAWTFILIKSAADLSDAVTFAKQYEPAVIFAEDIDAVVKGERSIDMDGILNVVDGAESKGRELMIVLTTNHPELINKAMMRPGRVDALIEVTAPDAEAVERLVRIYARALLSPDEDITEVGVRLAGHKAATIREVVEKAKLAAIANQGGTMARVTAQDLLTAAVIMEPHFRLMEEKPRLETPTLDSAFKTAMVEAVKHSSNGKSAAAAPKA